MVINIGNFYQIYKLRNLKPLNFKNGIWSLRIRPGFGMSMPNATSAFSIKVQPAIWNGVLRAIKEDINSFKFKNKCKWNFKLSRKWLKWLSRCLTRRKNLAYFLSKLYNFRLKIIEFVSHNTPPTVPMLLCCPPCLLRPFATPPPPPLIKIILIICIHAFACTHNAYKPIAYHYIALNTYFTSSNKCFCIHGWTLERKLNKLRFKFMAKNFKQRG